MLAASKTLASTRDERDAHRGSLGGARAVLHARIDRQEGQRRPAQAVGQPTAMDAMSAPSEAGSATAAALKFERRAEEFEVKRFAGLTGFQSAREVAKMQQRHEA